MQRTPLQAALPRLRFQLLAANAHGADHLLVNDGPVTIVLDIE